MELNLEGVKRKEKYVQQRTDELKGLQKFRKIKRYGTNYEEWDTD